MKYAQTLLKPRVMERVLAKITVLGSFNMDLTIHATTLPRPGETVLGEALRQSPGGKGSNQAIAAARLGAAVCFIGAVGQDPFGADALALHAREGIDTQFVLRSEMPTGAALLVVDAAGENQIAVAPGANSAVSVDVVDAAAGAIQEADVLLVQLEIPIPTFMAAARIAREAGTQVILNPAPWQPLPDDGLSLVDVLTPNEVELAALSGKAGVPEGVEVASTYGIESIVVTQGAAGASVFETGSLTQVAAYEAEAVDTTGAGDAFNGALAVRLGSGDSLASAVDFALRAGAHAVGHRGVIDALAHVADLEVIR